MQLALLIALSCAEIALFVMLLRFLNRLRRSEDLLTRLQDGQQSLLDKLRTNAELERELMHSFIARQAELQLLNQKLEDRAKELSQLVEQAESISRSPQFLRELIIAGTKKGRLPQQLAKSTGLSLDEVELILAQAKL